MKTLNKIRNTYKGALSPNGAVRCVAHGVAPKGANRGNMQIKYLSPNGAAEA